MCRSARSHGGVAIVAGAGMVRLVNLIKGRRGQALGSGGGRLRAARIGKAHASLVVHGLSAVRGLRQGLLTLSVI